MARIGALTLLMALLAVPQALSQTGQTSYTADLDGDAERETVRAAPVPSIQDPGATDFTV